MTEPTYVDPPIMDPNGKPYPPTFDQAMCLAQLNLPTVKKTKKADVKNKEGKYLYSYMYADLGDVYDVGLPHMARFGFSWVCAPLINEEGVFVLRYGLRHVHGQKEGGDWPLPPSNSNPQLLGSAITYGERYLFQALTGIAPDDDDGAAASGVARDAWEDAAPARPRATVSEPKPARPRTRTQAAKPDGPAKVDTPETLAAEIAKATDRGQLSAIKERVTELGLEGAQDSAGVTLLDIIRLMWREVPPAPWAPNSAQNARLHALLKEDGVDISKRDEKLATINSMLPADRFVESTKELTREEYDNITSRLEAVHGAGQRPKAKAE